MSEFLREGFDKAIRRDLSPEMNDEEGMFHLFVYELIGEEVKHFVDLLVMESILESIVNEPETALRQLFEHEWA